MAERLALRNTESAHVSNWLGEATFRRIGSVHQTDILDRQWDALHQFGNCSTVLRSGAWGRNIWHDESERKGIWWPPALAPREVSATLWLWRMARQNRTR
jgi:hypothetical protein